MGPVLCVETVDEVGVYRVGLVLEERELFSFGIRLKISLVKESKIYQKSGFTCNIKSEQVKHF